MPGFRLSRGQVIVLAVATAVAWIWLGRTERNVTWLTVEAPGHAVAGEVLPLRVHVASLPEASLLCVDLHWSSVRDASHGYLASGGTKPAGKEGGQFDFEILVRAETDLRFVTAIIFLSPTGDWNDHTFVAATELIPVKSGHDVAGSTVVRWPVRQLVDDGGQVETRPKAFPRLLTGFMLLAASVMAWGVFRSISGSLKTSKPERSWWLAMAVALTLAGIWELFGLEDWVGAGARAWARAEDVYYPRALFQKGAISLTFATMLVFLGLVWHKHKPHQLALFFLGLYLAISIVNLLSFHSIDNYAGRSWHGITLVAALKFVCAAATLNSVFRARR